MRPKSSWLFQLCSLLLLMTMNPLFGYYFDVLVLCFFTLVSFRYISFRMPFLVLLATIVSMEIAFYFYTITDGLRFVLLLLTYIFIPFLYLCRYNSKANLFELERNFRLLTCLSLVGYLVIYLSDGSFEFFTYSYGDSSQTFVGYSLVVTNFLKHDSLLLRFVGFSSEPAMWGYISLLFLSVHLSKRTTDIKVVLIYCVSIFLTVSTFAVGLLFVVMMLRFKRYRFLLVSIILLAGFYFIDNILSLSLVRKVTDVYLLERYEPTFTAFKYFLENPLGVGSTGYSWLLENNYNVGSFDSYTQIMLRFGVVGLSIYFGLLYGLFKSNRYVFIVISVASLSQLIFFLPLTILFFLGAQKNV